MAHAANGLGRHGGGGAGRPDAEETAQERVDELEAWVAQVVSDGGVTLPEAAQSRLDAIADRLEDQVAEGVDGLGPYERLLNGLAHTLERVGEHGDRSLGDRDGDGVDDTVLSLAIDRLDDLLDTDGDDLSAEVVASLQAVQAQLEAVAADGAVADDELDAVTAAAEAVQAVVDGDFAKLSDTGLAALTEAAADARTLADTGFLALDDDELATFVAAQSALAGLGDDATAAEVHEIVEDLRAEVPGYLVGLAGAGAGGPGHGAGLSAADYLLV